MRPVAVLDVLLGVDRLLDSFEHYTKRSGSDAADERNGARRPSCGATPLAVASD
jgi:hypothetical protein